MKKESRHSLNLWRRVSNVDIFFTVTQSLIVILKYADTKKLQLRSPCRWSKYWVDNIIVWRWIHCYYEAYYRWMFTCQNCSNMLQFQLWGGVCTFLTRGFWPRVFDLQVYATSVSRVCFSWGWVILKSRLWNCSFLYPLHLALKGVYMM